MFSKRFIFITRCSFFNWAPRGPFVFWSRSNSAFKALFVGRRCWSIFTKRRIFLLLSVTLGALFGLCIPPFLWYFWYHSDVLISCIAFFCALFGRRCMRCSMFSKRFFAS